MQNTISKNSLINCTDLKISCTNPQCLTINEELASLRQQVLELKETVVCLENTIQIKDVQLQTVQRDNERLSAELKKEQRCVRNIKQQLDDERFFYQREKDYFNDEMQRQKLRCANGTSKSQQRWKEIQEARDSLEDENKSLRAELKDKAETTYNLCIKFLRMKYAKDSLRQKLDKLLGEHLQVMADMMEQLDEARRELNIIVSDKFQDPLPLSKAKFLQMLQRNARLVHENAMLKVQIQHLNLDIDKLKSCTQKSKLINVDAKIISKLAEQSGRKGSKESMKWLPYQSSVEKTDRTLSHIKPSNHRNSVPGDYSGDAKLISKIRSNNLKKYVDAIVREIEPEETKEIRAERAYSAPEIVRPEVQPSCSTIGQTDSSIDFRDAFTNT